MTFHAMETLAPIGIVIGNLIISNLPGIVSGVILGAFLSIRQEKASRARQIELVSLMEQMLGKPEDEQRRIVEKAKTMPIVMELSAGRPVVGDLNVTVRKSPKSESRDT